jgi:hypothetical protein
VTPYSHSALTDDNFRKLMGIVEVNEDGENPDTAWAVSVHPPS